MYDSPISTASRNRLNALREHTDGFKLAHLDLSIRGPGEVFGKKQSGTESFRIADLVMDAELLQEPRVQGERLLKEDPEMASKIIDTWTSSESDYAAV